MGRVREPPPFLPALQREGEKSEDGSGGGGKRRPQHHPENTTPHFFIYLLQTHPLLF
jgi:hypothetical protein